MFPAGTDRAVDGDVRLPVEWGKLRGEAALYRQFLGSPPEVEFGNYGVVG